MDTDMFPKSHQPNDDAPNATTFAPTATAQMQLQVYHPAAAAQQVYAVPLASHEQVVADKDLFLSTLTKFLETLGTKLSYISRLMLDLPCQRLCGSITTYTLFDHPDVVPLDHFDQEFRFVILAFFLSKAVHLDVVEE
eukprot:Gb_35020 [translate_table: standard]